MGRIYLNDPNGLKEPKLFDVQVENPEKLFEESRNFICENLINADPEQTFFGQNMGTHAAQIATLVKRFKPEIKTVVVSDHEIRWLKEMFEIPGYRPDSTHSNYHLNDPIQCPTLSVKLAPFLSYASAIQKTKGPAIFYVSHVSRLTGETQNIEELYRLVKTQHPSSILIVDGAQALGVLRPVNVSNTCDAYIGMRSKFLGAEPNLGFVFFGESFAKKYGVPESYPAFDPLAYDKDLYSLWENLKHPLYEADYYSYIIDLKEYATKTLSKSAPSRLFVPPNQSPGFLTLDFGSKTENEHFVAYAEKNGVVISDNTNELWSIIPAPKPLVRVGLSVRTTKADIDVLV